MNILPFIIAAVCCILGILFYRGKGSFLIAGYNTASKAEKEQYDEKALCRFTGRLMFAVAGCQILAAFSWIGLALTAAVVIAAAAYANTGNRFRK